MANVLYTGKLHMYPQLSFSASPICRVSRSEDAGTVHPSGGCSSVAKRGTKCTESAVLPSLLCSCSVSHDRHAVVTCGIITLWSCTCHIVVTHAHLAEESVDAGVFETCQCGKHQMQTRCPPLPAHKWYPSNHCLNLCFLYFSPHSTPYTMTTLCV